MQDGVPICTYIWRPHAHLDGHHRGCGGQTPSGDLSGVVPIWGCVLTSGDPGIWGVTIHEKEDDISSKRLHSLDLGSGVCRPERPIMGSISGPHMEQMEDMC